jgi:hypothetical protein
MKVDELLPEHREGVWRDSEGDYWKFIDGTWHYQKGTHENDWESTEDEQAGDYGPFELMNDPVDCPACGDGGTYWEDRVSDSIAGFEIRSAGIAHPDGRLCTDW